MRSVISFMRSGVGLVVSVVGRVSGMGVGRRLFGLMLVVGRSLGWRKSFMFVCG